jgi:excisionase family DNA binding protein
MTTETVMTPADLAEETHLSLRFIYQQMKKGVIPNVKVGDRYLIGREAFLRWVNGDIKQVK